MVSILLLLGAALLLAGSCANAVQSEQRKPVRIEVEREPKRRQRDE